MPSEELIESTTTLKLDELLGEGSLGSVHKAFDPSLNRYVAVKKLHSQFAENDLSEDSSESTSANSARQFWNEAKIAANLDHPGVPAIIGIGEVEKTPFYAMRLIDGETLDVFVESNFYDEVNGISRSTFLRIFLDLCSIVQYAHSKGFLHCDIKPSNVMIGQHREVLLVDWGSAVVASSDRGGISAGMGSPIFMSPEHHDDQPITAQSDIYSLGATLYFMLGRAQPFASALEVGHKSGSGALAEKVIRGDVKALTDIDRTIPPALESIVKRAMSVQPKDRYTSVDELSKDLERFLENEFVTAHTYTPWEKLALHIRRKAAHWASVVIAIILLIVLLCASLAYIAWNKSGAVKAKHAAIQLAATFAAQAVADRINDRWQALELAARDPAILAILDQSNSNETIDWDEATIALSSFVARHHLAAGSPSSWIICDKSGKQLARIPESESSVGKVFSHRDYFHGKGEDLPEGMKVSPEDHIKAPYVSNVYLSQADNDLKVNITVPVWDTPHLTPESKFLGIVGMSVRLGEFSELNEHLSESQVAMVIDLGENVIDKQTLEGLVLHHPKLANGHKMQVDNNHLKSIRHQREKLAGNLFVGPFEKGRSEHRSYLQNAFRDPISDKLCTAATSPVMITSRSREIGDIGWAVIIIESD